MTTLREDIQRLYRENPKIGGAQILQMLNRKPTPAVWRVLVQVQIEQRICYSGRRLNRGITYRKV